MVPKEHYSLLSRENDFVYFAVMFYKVHFKALCDVFGKVREVFSVFCGQDDARHARSLGLSGKITECIWNTETIFI